MAGFKQGPAFLKDLVARRVPANDSLAMLGIKRAVQRMARAHAVPANPAAVVSLIESVPQANVILATAMLDGIAEGWPEERAPQLTPEQRTALAQAARSASPDLAPAFTKVATRWTLPDVFRGQ
jgi:hypothetical protein